MFSNDSYSGGGRVMINFVLGVLAGIFFAATILWWILGEDID